MDDQPAEGLPVYAFGESTYTGFHATTDASGQDVLAIPQGAYRFRADYTLSGTGDGVHFWSGETDHCVVPGCLEATVELPGGGGTEPQNVTIDYTYDPLYRLTAADYDSGEYFHYAYDEVGNRLTQETQAGTNAYTYDDANRLTEIDGVSYAWSANGNLLSDGESTYTYDHANRLTSLTQGEDTYSYAYNGLGDRLQQTVNGEAMNYTLDTVTGLTQVLDDGANVYLYGLDRVGEEQPAGWAYHIPDALGSVRQLTDADSDVTLTQSYEPFGSVMASSGLGETSYSFTGEWADGTGLMHLRARYYAPWQGRFLSRDKWNGNSNTPMSLNAWLYGYANPVNYSDPTGQFPIIIWDPLLPMCFHCYLITDSDARRLCFEQCMCGFISSSQNKSSLYENTSLEDLPISEAFIDQRLNAWWLNDTNSPNTLDYAEAVAFIMYWEFGEHGYIQDFGEATARQYFRKCGAGGCSDYIALVSWFNDFDAWNNLERPGGLDELKKRAVKPNLYKKIARYSDSSSWVNIAQELLRTNDPLIRLPSDQFPYVPRDLPFTWFNTRPNVTPNWLREGLRNASPGTKDNQVVWIGTSSAGKNEILALLTLGQQWYRCGDTSCATVRLTTPKPNR